MSVIDDLIHIITDMKDNLEKLKDFLKNNKRVSEHFFSNMYYIFIIFIPLIIAFIAQLLLIYSHSQVSKLYSFFHVPLVHTICSKFSFYDRVDFGLIFYFIAIILILIFYKSFPIAGSTARKILKSPKSIKVFNKKAVVILNSLVAFIVSYVILFYLTYIEQSYNTILLLLVWFVCLGSLLIMFLYIDGKYNIFRFIYLKKSEIILLLIIMGFVCVTGIPYLKDIPLLMHVDQFMIMDESVKTINKILNIKLFSHVGQWTSPYIGFMPTILFVKLFGSADSFGYRFTSIFFVLLMVPVFYLLVRNTINRRIAEISTIILVATHLILYYERANYFAVQVIFIAMLAMFFFVLSLKNNSFFYMVLAGFTTALTLYCWGGGSVIIPVLFFYSIYLFFRYKKIRLTLISKLLVFVFSFIIFLSPLCFSSWVNNKFITLDIGFSCSTIFGNPEKFIEKKKEEFNNTNSIIEIMYKQVHLALMRITCFPDGSNFYGVNHPMLDFFMNICLLCSIFLLLFKRKNPFIVLFLITIFSTLFFGGILTLRANSKRLFVALPYVVVLCSMFIVLITGLISRLFSNIKIQKMVYKFLLYLIITTIVFTNINIFYNFYVKDNIIEQRYQFDNVLVMTVNYFNKKYNLYTNTNNWDNKDKTLATERYPQYIFFFRYPYDLYFNTPGCLKEIDIFQNQLPITEKQDKDVLFVFNGNSHYYAINVLLHHYPEGKVFFIPFNSDYNYISVFYIPKEVVNAKINGM